MNPPRLGSKRGSYMGWQGYDDRTCAGCGAKCTLASTGGRAIWLETVGGKATVWHVDCRKAATKAAG